MTLGPVHKYPFLSRKNRIFFSILDIEEVHTYHVKMVTENAYFKKRSPEWRVLKTPAYHFRVDGQSIAILIKYFLTFYKSFVLYSGGIEALTKFVSCNANRMTKPT